MLIDKAGAGSDVTIVLFPRSYNKRGDERLHSVQGVTLDGREVNIKLRVDEAMQGKENTPSIAEFSREDVKAKNPCLASANNGPEHREGVLLFTGCEEDGENKKGLLSFTARWGYVLASHSDAPEPVFGLGRVVMIADSHAAKSIHAEITELERTKIDGWEAISEHKRKALSDPMLFSYYGQLYIHEEEAGFEPKDKEALVEFARESFAKHTKSGVVGGLLIRIQDKNGDFVPGFSPEVFPRWKPGSSYQSADDVLGFFFRANAKHMTPDLCSKIMVMPIKRYSCGPSFKNYYFLKKPEESLQKLRRRFLINNEPTVGEIAFALSRREDSGESFMLKYYPMGNPVSSVADIGKPQIEDPSPSGRSDSVQHIHPSSRPPVGLSEASSLTLPSWYSPGSLSGLLDTTEGRIVSAPPISTDNTDKVIEEVVLTPVSSVADSAVEGLSNTTPESDLQEILPDDDDLSETASDGDLSDLFAEITDEELAEIEITQKLALEERAKADLILAEQEAALEAKALADEQANENTASDPSTDTTPVDHTKSSTSAPKNDITSVKDFRFVDDTAEKGNREQGNSPHQEPLRSVISEEISSEVATKADDRELSSLEKQLKLRGLL